MGILLFGLAALAGGVVFWLVLSMLFRTVVATNDVHIVQSKKLTLSYGKDKDNGNVYYKWPSWIPHLGITTIELPVSNFDLNLNNYEAYDQDKVPFVVDVTAFFRISETNIAAQRVTNIEELRSQLNQIVQGAVRSILASHNIDAIMLQRETFGDAFTKAVKPELVNWGVEPVKNLELMDIRDARESNVIANIMAKKKSHIEMESRVEVAENNRRAKEAEIEANKSVQVVGVEAQRTVDTTAIEAKKTVDTTQIAATQIVGEKNAEKDQKIGVANEQAKQEIKEEAAATAVKDMKIVEVNTLRQADITRDQAAIGLVEAGHRADAVLREGTAEADVREKIFKADNALEIRLTIQKDTSIGVAQALASGNVKLVPEVFIGGGGDGEGDPSNAVDTLTKLMTMNLAQAGSTDSSARGNGSIQ